MSPKPTAPAHATFEKVNAPHILKLSFQPPFDWPAQLAMFRAHENPFLETVDEAGYQRIVCLSNRRLASFHVRFAGHALEVAFSRVDEAAIPILVQNIRRMFDLDADPLQIAETMSREPHLAAIWSRHPGIRVARFFNPFETIVSTILGQLVSVSFGRTLLGELMQCAGSKARHPDTRSTIYRFPTPRQILAADLSTVRTSPMRRTALKAVAQMVVDKTLLLTCATDPKQLRKTLLSVPGIGAWSSEYIAMRGFDDNDAFPATDYVLKQQLKRHPTLDMNKVRPFRAYAAAAFWKTFAETKYIPVEAMV